MTETQSAGRYAPSPTGNLHFGAFVAALASFLQSRSRGAAWYVRIEDIDPAREVPGAADALLHALEVHGLTWDGSVLFQSTRRSAYRAALDQLLANNDVFGCGCTRREAQSGPLGIEGRIYPGTCRGGLLPGRQARSLRARVGDTKISFDDGVFGSITQNLAHDVGDFVVRRADGLTAYQLAVVLDDAYQGVTEVVRGADLLTSTPRQLLLQSRLDLPQPKYWHVPLLVAADGCKLGKSRGAPPLDLNRPAATLFDGLCILGQTPPDDLATAGLPELLGWAIHNWDIRAVPRTPYIAVD